MLTVLIWIFLSTSMCVMEKILSKPKANNILPTQKEEKEERINLSLPPVNRHPNKHFRSPNDSTQFGTHSTLSHGKDLENFKAPLKHFSQWMNCRKHLKTCANLTLIQQLRIRQHCEAPRGPEQYLSWLDGSHFLHIGRSRETFQTNMLPHDCRAFGWAPQVNYSYKWKAYPHPKMT